MAGPEQTRARAGRWLITALLLYAGIVPGSATGWADDGRAIEPLLREVGIEPQEVGITPANLELLLGAHPHSPLTALLLAEPLRTDALTRVMATLLSETAAQSPVETLAQMSRFNGRLVRRGLVANPLDKAKAAASQPGALADALRTSGATSTDVGDVPASVQEAATVLILTAREAAQWVRRSQESTGGEVEQGRYEQLQGRLHEPPKTGAEEETELRENSDPDFDRWFKRRVESFATEALAVGAEDLLLALEFARGRLTSDVGLTAAAFDVQIKTELGWVILADGRENQHTYDGPILLIIDTGGDDRYTSAGANFDVDHPISLALDLAGNDRYQAGPSSTGTFGAGLLGIGILEDDGGNDIYEGGSCSQGVGLFGVGILIDGAGDDAHRAIDAAQGCAIAGYALLIDRAGDDRYDSYRNSQASAGPNAAALLIDLGGNDRYVANDSDIRYPSAQNRAHNNSLCQGVAAGWRADYSGGLSINGGVAMLLDGGGDDEYSCGLFGQGVGYWNGAGLLLDQGGNDRYAGHWYVQGASAHFAVGVLVDRDGDDVYTANQNMSQGAGHDTGVGVLIDDAGDDLYRGSPLGLGAANDAGVGLFIDKTGDDRYETPPSDCLGWANPSAGYRAVFRSYGLFFDLSGRDTYVGLDGRPGRAGAGDGQTWRTPADPHALGPYLFGYGMDRDATACER